MSFPFAPSPESISSPEQQLFEHCRINDAPSVLCQLYESRGNLGPGGVDVNWRNPELFNYTCLHIASICGHANIVSLLLQHPNISVNQLDLNGSSPFLLACMAGRTEVAKCLLHDARINVNQEDKWRVSPLWWAANNGHFDVVRWIIASGRAYEGFLAVDRLPTNTQDLWNGRERNLLTAIEIARGSGRTSMVTLLQRFMGEPIMVQRELALELGYCDMQVAKLFALVVFLCDDYLVVREGGGPDRAGFRRFFRMAAKLPMELQMLLCNRAHRSMKNLVLMKTSRIAFKAVLPVSGPSAAEAAAVSQLSPEQGFQAAHKIKDFLKFPAPKRIFTSAMKFLFLRSEE